jgi:hypothetical protein
MSSAVIVGMIMVGIIRSGANYFSHHFRMNDYLSMGQEGLLGEWIGKGIRLVGSARPRTQNLPCGSIHHSRYARGVAGNQISRVM